MSQQISSLSSIISSLELLHQLADQNELSDLADSIEAALSAAEDQALQVLEEVFVGGTRGSETMGTSSLREDSKLDLVEAFGELVRLDLVN